MSTGVRGGSGRYPLDMLVAMAVGWPVVAKLNRQT
jgi:hypothetical protein